MLSEADAAVLRGLPSDVIEVISGLPSAVIELIRNGRAAELRAQAPIGSNLQRPEQAVGGMLEAARGTLALPPAAADGGGMLALPAAPSSVGTLTVASAAAACGTLTVAVTRESMRASMHDFPLAVQPAMLLSEQYYCDEKWPYRSVHGGCRK